VANPSYEEVWFRLDRHAEACQIAYDPKIISYPGITGSLLENTRSHNIESSRETTPARNIGPQIFYHTRRTGETRRSATIENSIPPVHSMRRSLRKLFRLRSSIKAENYHQNYFNEHGAQPYCIFIIKPKVEKIKKWYLKDKLKEN